MADADIPTIITRKQARQQDLKFYFTGVPCRNGHLSIRHTSSINCRECAKEKSKNWRERNREKDIKRKIEDYHQNKDRHKIYRRANQHRANCLNKIRSEIPEKRLGILYCSARWRANKRKLDFDEEFVKSLCSSAPTSCRCCGVDFDFSSGKGKSNRDRSPSFDRVNNSFGYIQGNVCIICWKCNRNKRALSIADLEILLKYMKGDS